MERALKQYQTQVEEKAWGVESTDRKDIMSFNARMDKQEEVTNQKVTHQKNDDEVKAQQNATGSNSKQKWTERKVDKTPSWMKKPPSYSGERKFEQGNEYFWCPYHNLWQRHTASECRINPNQGRYNRKRHRQNHYSSQNRRDGRYNNSRRRDNDRKRQGGRSHNDRNRNHQRDNRENRRNNHQSRRRMALQAAEEDSDYSDESYDSQDDSVERDYDYSDDYDE
jgi:hypothetical protein